MGSFDEEATLNNILSRIAALEANQESMGKRNIEADQASDFADGIGDMDYTREDEDGKEIISMRREGLALVNPNIIDINFWASIGVPSNVATAIYAMAFSGTVLYVGGNFTKIGGISANHIAMYDTSTGVWSNVGSPTALNSTVRAIAISGSNVYVGGSFMNANGNANADFIALWNGSSWSALGAASLNGTVYAIAISGPNVYVGGQFTNADGIAAADYFALWNGLAWSAVGSSSLNNSVLAIAISGSNVYVGGNFTNADGIAAADYFALWNGLAWSAVGSSLLNNNVEAIAISDSNVYIGGNFTTAAGIAGADYIALWDETASAWTGLGVNSLNNKVTAIAIYGSTVYFGGYFTDADGIADADGIVGWDGANYFLTGNAGVSNGDNVTALALYGKDLYVGGSFFTAGGRASLAIAAYLVSLQSVLAYLEIVQQALQDAIVTDSVLYNVSTLAHGLVPKQLYDSQIYLSPWVTIRKTVDEAISSSAILHNDAELLVAVAAGTKYHITGKIFFDTGAAEDFKFRFQNTGTATLMRAIIKYIVPGTTAIVPMVETAFPTTTVSVAGAGTTGGYIEFDFILHNNTAGAFIFQWAQNTSGVNPTTTRAASYLRYMVS